MIFLLELVDVTILKESWCYEFTGHLKASWSSVRGAIGDGESKARSRFAGRFFFNGCPANIKPFCECHVSRLDPPDWARESFFCVSPARADLRAGRDVRHRRKPNAMEDTWKRTQDFFFWSCPFLEPSPRRHWLSLAQNLSEATASGPKFGPAPLDEDLFGQLSKFRRNACSLRVPYN